MASNSKTKQPAPAKETAQDAPQDASARVMPSEPDPKVPEDGDEQPPRTVLILRDETLMGVDYRPGDLPELPGEFVDGLVARRVADDNPKAIAAARKGRRLADEEERVIS